MTVHRSSRSAPLAVGLAVVGGLALIGATSGDWVLAETLREVGGVELVAPRGTPGIDLAPRGVAAGVLGAVGGLALVLARGRGRRLVGGLLLVVGAAGTGVVVAGIAQAAREVGRLTPAPWLALAGAAAMLLAGVVALRRPAPAPVLGDRYTLEADEAAADDEWGLASGED